MNWRIYSISKCFYGPSSFVDLRKLQLNFNIHPPRFTFVWFWVICWFWKFEPRGHQPELLYHACLNFGKRLEAIIPGTVGRERTQIASSSLFSSMRSAARFNRASTLSLSLSKAEHKRKRKMREIINFPTLACKVNNLKFKQTTIKSSKHSMVLH